jgi:hypothetical protein
MMPPDAELRHQGDIVVAPCLSFYLVFELGALERPERDVLEMYQWARDALGSALTHVDVDGNGKYRALNARNETMVPTWLSRPRDEKVYWAQFWGAAKGVSAASLKVTLSWIDVLGPELLRTERRKRRDWKTPMGRVSCIQITFPLDHPLASGVALVSQVSRLSLVRKDIVCGVGGLALNWLNGRQGTNLGGEIRDHRQSFVSRFPGFELDPEDFNLFCLVEWDNARDDYAYRIPRNGWLTLLGPRIVQELGGLSSIVRAVDDPAVQVVDLSPSVAVVAGPEPDVGDRAASYLPPAYLAVGKALRPVRTPTWRFRWDRKGDWIDEWQRAFDGTPGKV